MTSNRTSLASPHSFSRHQFVSTPLQPKHSQMSHHYSLSNSQPHHLHANPPQHQQSQAVEPTHYLPPLSTHNSVCPQSLAQPEFAPPPSYIISNSDICDQNVYHIKPNLQQTNPHVRQDSYPPNTSAPLVSLQQLMPPPPPPPPLSSHAPAANRTLTPSRGISHLQHRSLTPSQIVCDVYQGNQDPHHLMPHPPTSPRQTMSGSFYMHGNARNTVNQIFYVLLRYCFP